VFPNPALDFCSFQSNPRASIGQQPEIPPEGLSIAFKNQRINGNYFMAARNFPTNTQAQ
jgi:hypothetical protein